MGWRGVVGFGLVLAGLVACSQAPRTGPVERIRGFGAADTPIVSSGVTPDGGGWQIRRADAGSVQLFEVPQPNASNAPCSPIAPA